ncbi:hypothetical protein G6F57_004564 [Rhizopus arrhizus]|nr:hypothetical protein G6F23_002495 [Rhizopus arrhizus]KAG1421434.1 hypothetical protein G6F58_003750 [Rhizopus delemar]KAG0768781.1 hypothetical protein G6F24_001641 [Rhizopus arrhizus]KAG0775693.1 hypothetical protein G6F22_013111 [Rhizopus arrhizus]KAG0792288.1 hypothetical protein G6F21_004462 [Rhizopus arrhizus]
MHSAANCPLGSMAWITVNEKNKVIHVTEEMEQILGYNPLDQSLDTLWTYQHKNYVTLQSNGRTLFLCTHHQGKNKIFVCLDTTSPSYLQQPEDVSILRLSMYGTVETAFSSQSSLSCTSWIGQPVMRYIHSDDVGTFCAGLSKATRFSCLVQFSVRLQEGLEWFEWTVMSIENGQQLICFIKPSGYTHQTTFSFPCSPGVYPIITQAQQKFWKALEDGMTWAIHHLAYSLLLLVQSVLNLLCYKKKLEYLIKQRSKIDLMFPVISYSSLLQYVTRF